MLKALRRQDTYLSSKEAGKLLGYTHDYISKLCREGRMSGIQKGRIWYVTEKEARSFHKRHEAELEKKKADLSKKFSQLRQEHETKRQGAAETAAGAETAPLPPREAPVKPRVDLSSKRRVRLTLPHSLAAAGVLAAVLLFPSAARLVSTGAFSPDKGGQAAAPVVSQDFVNGTMEVLKAQADLAAQTANAYSFAQDLSDGYWQLAVNTTLLCQQFYRNLEVISDSYLTLYVFQGEMIYDSILDINSMGALVLEGYQLVGHSFLVGGSRLWGTYAEMLNLREQSAAAQDRMQAQVSGALEGFAYAKNQVVETFGQAAAFALIDAPVAFLTNVRLNLDSMATTIRGGAELVTATVSQAISFDLKKDDQDIRAVELSGQ